MLKQNSGKLMLIIIALFLCASFEVSSQEIAGGAPTPKPPRKTFKLKVEVNSSDPAEKVNSATVHVESREEGGFVKDVRTNKQGIAKVSNVPQGKFVIQVVARDHDTFGMEQSLTQDQTIKITLKKRSD